MKKTFLPFIAFVLITSIFFACQKESTLPDNLNTDKNPVIGTDDRASYVIPAGSINALAAALQDYSTVILAPGIHTEDGPVTVSGYKKIIGQDGAVLRVNTTPFVNPEVPLQVALHLDHASGSAVHGLIIESSTPVGGTGILVENSTKVSIQNCKLRNFQFSILVEKSPLVNIHQNIIEASTAWQTGEISEGHGIVI
ncbi:MAG: hypothetical protein IT269_02250, partial [Saprospiraceae bacterium]|nr:hypothetical protein [Saprospiraceae bacterium]